MYQSLTRCQVTELKMYRTYICLTCLNKVYLQVYVCVVCVDASLSEMSDVHRLHVHEKEDLLQRVDSSLSATDKLKAQTKQHEAQYRFFQETRDYTRNLVECLNEKVKPLMIMNN